jgi:hypothetical protein
VATRRKPVGRSGSRFSLPQPALGNHTRERLGGSGLRHPTRFLPRPTCSRRNAICEEPRDLPPDRGLNSVANSGTIS